MPRVERILKDKVRHFYKNYKSVWPVYSTDFYIDKTLIKEHKLQEGIKKKLINIKKNCPHPKTISKEDIYLKFLPFIKSDGCTVELNIDIPGLIGVPFYLLICNFKKRSIDTLDKIADIINEMNDDEYYNSITVNELNTSEQIIKKKISSYDSTKSESFYIYQIIIGNPLETFIVSEPFSPYSHKRLHKVNAAKIDEYEKLYKNDKSNIVIYYLNSLFESGINNDDELQFKNEIKYKIKFYNIENDISYQSCLQNGNLTNDAFPINQSYNNLLQFQEQHNYNQSNINNIDFPLINSNPFPSMYPENFSNDIYVNNEMNDVINHTISPLSLNNDVLLQYQGSQDLNQNNINNIQEYNNMNNFQRPPQYDSSSIYSSNIINNNQINNIDNRFNPSTLLAFQYLQLIKNEIIDLQQLYQEILLHHYIGYDINGYLLNLQQQEKILQQYIKHKYL